MKAITTDAEGIVAKELYVEKGELVERGETK